MNKRKQAAVPRKEAGKPPAAGPTGRRQGKGGSSRRPRAPAAEKTRGRAKKAASRARRPRAARARAGGPRAARPARDWLDPDAFFVARVRGEEAVRAAPHPLAEADEPEDEASLPASRSTPASGRGLGDLPPGYGEDALVGLPRDPRTLFFYWDHASQTLEDAFRGLEAPRAQLWLFERRGEGDWQPCRTVELALESRSHYVHELDPGHTYRADIRVVGRSGEARPLGAPSAAVTLPPLGPSPLLSDSFARVPRDRPGGEGASGGVPAPPFSEELRLELALLSDWPRPRGGARGGEAGGVGGRPALHGGAAPGEEGA